MNTRPLDDIPQSRRALDRRAASRDLWPGGTLAMWLQQDAPLPARVFWPESDADVQAILESAAEQDAVVVPYGAGSGVCGGARSGEDAWVLDTKRFDQIGEVDDRWVVEAGAGVNGQHLEDALGKAGFTLGHSPSSIWCSTVGGWAAARSAGQFSSRYGVFEDMVVGLDAVAPGYGAFHVGLPGERSPSRRAPDSWMPLLLGSEGTLAVITRVRMRVRPKPKTRWLRGYQFEDVTTALQAMRSLMQAELWPSTVRLYDPIDTFIGGKTRPKGDKQQGAAWWKSWLEKAHAVPALRRRALALPLSMPHVLQAVAEGLSSGCLLVVGFEGEPGVVAAASRVGHDMVCELGRDLGAAPGERWYASRHAVSYKLMPVFEHGGFADTMEVAARWSVLPGLYAAVRAAVGRHVLVMAHMSHLYPEGGSIYFSFAGRGNESVYRQTWERAMEAVLQAGGTVTHHHGVGTLKAHAASREAGAAVEGWRQLKRVLDPRGTMNPGRVFVEVDADPSDVLGDELATEDGLIRVSARADLQEQLEHCGEGQEPLWLWSSLPGPPRWQREPWQTTWIEVRGQIGGKRTAVGRGPRSASGSDLRGWLAEADADATATVGVSAETERWMGRAHLEKPWRVARALLRVDLRPAVLGVVDGALVIGFRGPAAAAMGAIATKHVPGGLEETPWQPVARFCHEALVPAADDHPQVVAVTTESAWRLGSEEKP